MTYVESKIRSLVEDRAADTVVAVRSSLVALLASVAVGVVSFGALPDRVQVRWDLVSGSFTGPEFAPKILVVALFPALVATLAVGAYWLGNYLESAGTSAESRRSYRLAVMGTLVTVLGAQAFVVLANVA